ncbi:MAG: XRE family transcriptional regulator [Actinomycetia bacterium]|nr:XRE family transcriptional regulator [Actinomycetes bacterium]
MSRGHEAAARLLHRRRRQRGLTQVQLAEAAELSEKTIRAIERAAGGGRPRPSTLARIYNALEMSDSERVAVELAYDGAGSAEPSPISSGRLRSLGQALCAAREQRGLTKRELHRRSGVTANTIGNLESGRSTRARHTTILRLADALQLRGAAREEFMTLARGGSIETVQPLGRMDIHGRRHELAQLLALVTENQLVTVTGLGGIGKTTLALAAATELTRSSRFVSLAEQPPGTTLLNAVAGALGLDKPTPANISDGLDGVELVVLDNLEHLTDPVDGIDVILASAHESLSILATSRRPLRAPNERMLRLEPLDRAASVTLLRQRVEEANGLASWHDDDQAARSICRRLDDVPLAIELVAAWSSVLAPRDTLRQLENPLTLLGDGPGRHGGVRAVVAWSVELIGPSARVLFSELSLHPTGWSYDYAARVHGDDGQLAGAIRELVEAGLLGVVNEGPSARYHMLTLVREVAGELLSDELRAEVVGRRAAWLIEEAKGVDADLTGTAQLERLEQLDQDREHVNLGLEHLLTSRSPRSIDVAGGLWRYWQVRGLYQSGAERIQRALSLGADTDPSSNATATYGLAVLVYLTGDVDTARSISLEALAAFRHLGLHHGIGSSSSLLGMIEQHQGSIDVAERIYRSAMDAVPPREAPRAYASLISNLATLLADRGQLDEAIELAEDALAQFRHLGDERGVADQAGNVARWLLVQGHAERALDAQADVLDVFHTLRDPGGQAEAYTTLVDAKLHLGQLDEAETMLDRANDVIDEMNEAWGVAQVRSQRALLLALREDYTAAVRQARLAAVEADRLPYRPAQLRNALTLAAAALNDDDDTKRGLAAAGSAVELCGTAHPALLPIATGMLARLAGRNTRDDHAATALALASAACLESLPLPVHALAGMIGVKLAAPATVPMATHSPVALLKAAQRLITDLTQRE